MHYEPVNMLTAQDCNSIHSIAGIFSGVYCWCSLCFSVTWLAYQKLWLTSMCT